MVGRGGGGVIGRFTILLFIQTVPHLRIHPDRLLFFFRTSGTMERVPIEARRVFKTPRLLWRWILRLKLSEFAFFSSISRLLQLTLSKANELLDIVPSFSPLGTYLVACAQTLFYLFYFFPFFWKKSTSTQAKRARSSAEREKEFPHSYPFAPCQ